MTTQTGLEVKTYELGVNNNPKELCDVTYRIIENEIKKENLSSIKHMKNNGRFLLPIIRNLRRQAKKMTYEEIKVIIEDYVVVK